MSLVVYDTAPGQFDSTVENKERGKMKSTVIDIDQHSGNSFKRHCNLKWLVVLEVEHLLE